MHSIEMAEDRIATLTINVGEGFPPDMGATRKIVDVVDRTHQLSHKVKQVADTEKARDALKQFAETADLPTEMCMECALGAIK